MGHEILSAACKAIREDMGSEYAKSVVWEVSVGMTDCFGSGVSSSAVKVSSPSHGGLASICVTVGLIAHGRDGSSIST